MFQRLSQEILDELAQVLGKVKDEEFRAFQKALLGGRRIFVTGQPVWCSGPLPCA